MVDYDIQMKKNKDGSWDNLYPLSKTKNIYDNDRGKTLNKVLNDLDSKHETLKTETKNEVKKVQKNVSETPFQSSSIVFVTHRGLNKLAPENTIPAFDLAGQYGSKMVEFDIRMTSDNIPIIMHDDTVDRMTTGNGTVRSKTLNQIKQLTIDAGNRFTAYPETRVPTLEETLLICKKWNMNPFIHLYDEDGLYIVIDLLRKYHLENKCIIGMGINKTRELRASGNTAIKVVVSERTKDNVHEMIGLENVVAGTFETYPEEIKSIHEQGFPISDYDYLNHTNWRYANNKGIDYYLVDEIIDGGAKE